MESATEEESESAKMLASESAAATIKSAEEACIVEGRDIGRPPPPCPSIARPRNASLPPSSYASRAVAWGLTGTQASNTWAVRSRAQLVAVPLRLAGVDARLRLRSRTGSLTVSRGGDSGGVSGLRRWRLAGSKLG